MITGKNFIGTAMSSEGTVTFQTFNPMLNTKNLPVFHEASPDEINRAGNLAFDAFKDFRTVSGKQKAAYLNAIAEEIIALDDLLIQTYCSETGLPEGRAKGEKARTILQLRSFADLVAEGSWVEATIDSAIPKRTPIPKPDIRKMLIPLGPVAVFGASNFPLAYSTAGGDTAAALAAGCPVIVKSHPMHAGTGELVASSIIKAGQKTGMPNGVFSNLNSSGIHVGIHLVKHPKIKAVGFTGSIQGGRALLDLASKREEPIPVFAEMGSINPVVVLPEALQKNSAQIAKTLAASITLGAGQFCTNPGLIMGIKSEELTNFIQNLADEILQIQPSVMVHPSIRQAYKTNLHKTIAQPDVRLVTPHQDELDTHFARQVIATVGGRSFLENKNLHREVFGPFSLVVQCKDAVELEQIIADLEGQLTGAIMAENEELKAHSKIIDAMQEKVGRMIYNAAPTGVEVCPSMVHGGPYPSSTDSRFTAVGITSIKRWVRPFSFQDWPNNLLPDALKNENPLHISRYEDGIHRP